MLRGARLRRAARSVGCLRAVLGNGSCGGVRLPQTEAPPTIARRVIHYGPESHCRGSGSLCCGVRVGRRNGRSRCRVRTPPRKTRAGFEGISIHLLCVSLRMMQGDER